MTKRNRAWGEETEARLTAISRTRALTEAESRQLEHAIKEQSRGNPGFMGGWWKLEARQ